MCILAVVCIVGSGTFSTWHRRSKVDCSRCWLCCGVWCACSLQTPLLQTLLRTQLSCLFQALKVTLEQICRRSVKCRVCCFYANSAQTASASVPAACNSRSSQTMHRSACISTHQTLAAASRLCWQCRAITVLSSL